MSAQTFSWMVIVGIGALAGFGLAVMLLSAAWPAARMPSLRRVDLRRRLDPARWREAVAGPIAAARGLALRIPTARRKEAMDRALFAALGALRNYSKSGGGAQMTTDAILEEFAGRDGALQDAWATCLRMLRVGREAEIPAYFAEASMNDLGRDFMMLLLEWDRTDPTRLTDTVAAFQTAMKETRTTTLTRRTEAMSDLLYLPVVVGVLVVFMNFIYVAYFVEQRELLTELFF
ncbi:MAG: hypothetical protein LBR00_02270 [Clostridiales Family XIII bacterium]|jgi:hypothetical protein|nr:hypothetical protein [Clostridiales Family XIII bacterium]